METDFEGASAQIDRVESTREPQNGKVVSAKAWCGIPKNAEKFHVGVYWANEIPVTLHFAANAQTSLYLGDNEENWMPLDVFAGQNEIVVEFFPDADHVFVANFLPPPKPSEASEPESIAQEQSDEATDTAK